MGPLRTYTLGVSILLLILLEEATVHASLGLGSCKLFCEKYRPLHGDASCKDTTTGSCKVTCGDDRGCDDSCFFDCDCSGFIGSKSYDCPDPSAPEPPSKLEKAGKDLNTAGSALGLILGIVFGILFLIILIIVGCCVFCCLKKRKQAQRMQAGMAGPQAQGAPSHQQHSHHSQRADPEQAGEEGGGG